MMGMSESYSDSLVALVVDEAHCVKKLCALVFVIVPEKRSNFAVMIVFALMI